MARSTQEIQADAQRLSQQLSQTRWTFLRTEREIVAKLDALEAEIAQARAEEAKQAPGAILARLEALEAATKAANDKETA
jgi:hypothetical protein